LFACCFKLYHVYSLKTHKLLLINNVITSEYKNCLNLSSHRGLFGDNLLELLEISSFQVVGSISFLLCLDLDEVTPNEFLAPFLAVIRSEETTGPITGLALTSVNKFLSYGLIGELVCCIFIWLIDNLVITNLVIQTCAICVEYLYS